MKKFHYVYVTTNLINGKQYVGDHSTNNLNDKYLGSGKIIKEAIKKHGKNNFQCAILEFFDTKQEAFSSQEKYINELNTMIPNGYNLSPKGGANCFNGLSQESIEKLKKTLSNSIKGKPHNETWNKNVSEAKKGKNFSQEHKKHLSEAKKGKTSSFIGKHHSDETKKLISQKCKGHKHTEETKKKFKKRIPWNKGLRFLKV